MAVARASLSSAIHAEDGDARACNDEFIFGNNLSVTGNGNILIGRNNTATGTNNIVRGPGGIVIGDNSFAVDGLAGDATPTITVCVRDGGVMHSSRRLAQATASEIIMFVTDAHEVTDPRAEADKYFIDHIAHTYTVKEFVPNTEQEPSPPRTVTHIHYSSLDKMRRDTCVASEIRRESATEMKIMHVDGQKPSVAHIGQRVFIVNIEIAPSTNSPGCVITQKDDYTLIENMDEHSLDVLFGDQDIKTI